MRSYPTNCTECHNTNDWNEATFDHSSTNFPLTGAHVAGDCTSCHTNGYAGTSVECSNCHQTDYNQTTNPNHASLGLSISCNSCHTTNPGWEPATFLVHNNYYELNGAHANVANDCFLCHAGNYTSTTNTCYGCHATDYINTNEPNHIATQFPVNCESCHTESAWLPSTWEHDSQYFPIYRGKHKGEWNLCSECHTQPSNFTVFSCINCHEHNKTSTDNDHSEVSGYVYASANCLACHPNGNH